MAHGEHITVLAIIDGRTTAFESVAFHEPDYDADGTNGRYGTVVTRDPIEGLTPTEIRHQLAGPYGVFDARYSYAGRVIIVRQSGNATTVFR